MTNREYYSYRNLPNRLRYETRLLVTTFATVLGISEWSLKSCKRLEDLGEKMRMKNPTTSEIEMMRDGIYKRRPDLIPSEENILP